MSDSALRALAAADPVLAPAARDRDERLLAAIVAAPRRAEPGPRRATIVTLALCLLALGGGGAYAALASRDAARVDAALALAARSARPLSESESAAIARSNAADGALYRCLRERGTVPDASGGLSPSPAVRAACARAQDAAGAAHADPSVRAAFAAERVLVEAAWYCVQQHGYAVDADRRHAPPAGSELSAIWRVFAACEETVGMPAADRARTP